MSIRTILWDADGVLIQGEPFFVQYEKDFGVGYSAFEPFFESEEYALTRVGQASIVEAVKPWLSEWKWTGTAEEFCVYWAEKEDHPANEMLSIIEQLREQHGIRSLLASNQNAHRTAYLREQMNFDELLNSVYTSAELGVKKPNTQFYISILQSEFEKGFENPLDQVLYFDDKEVNVLAARAIGMHAYLFKTNQDAVDALQHHGLL